MRRLTLICLMITILIIFSGYVRADESCMTEVIYLPQSDLVTQVEWSPNGAKLATLSWSEIQIWRTDNWELAVSIPDPFVYAISWNPDGNLIAGVQGGDSETLVLWDATSGEKVGSFQRVTSPDPSQIAPPSHTIDWQPDGNFIASDATLSFDEILLWDVSAEKIDEPVVINVADNTWHNSANLVWSHNGEMLLTNGSDDLPPDAQFSTQRKSYIVLLESNQIRSSLTEIAMDWSPDDTRIVGITFTNGSQHIMVWQLETQQVLLNFHDHSNSISAIAWNTYSPVIASTDRQGTLLLWNPETGSIYPIDTGTLTRPEDLAWKPNSNTLAIADGNRVLIYNFGDSF